MTTAAVAVMASLVVDVRALRMRYGPVEAVAGIDVEVRPGEVFAFLGPNGAGKTTTVEILEGLRHRTAGEVSVLGEDPDRAGSNWRARIGVVLQESAPEPELTVEECVSLYAGYYTKSRSVEQMLGLVGLADRPAARCGQLSGGQRRRLDVALGLIGDPDLLFLDEPTTGFDPSARPRRLGHDLKPSGSQEDDLSYHPLHGGGRTSRRPDRGDRKRTHSR